MVDFAVEKKSMADHFVVTIPSESQMPIGLPEQGQEQRTQRIEELPRYVPVQLRHMSIDENSPLLSSHHDRAPHPKSKSRWLRLWKWYESELHSRPMLTKSVTAATLVGCGDLAGQCIELFLSSHTGNFLMIDWWRFARFAALGFFLQSPITHYYYLVLDDKLPPTPSPWTATTFIKLAIDQLLFAPIFTVLVFLFLGLLEGDSLMQIDQRLQLQFVTTIIANWKLWVPATFGNLAFCPPEFRVLYCNVIFFVWSIFLSLILNAH
jgi:peroxisomal membrane protein 2